MKKVTIYLPDGHDDVLSVTAIGTEIRGIKSKTNVISRTFDLSQGTEIRFIEGKWYQLDIIEEVTE